MNIGFNYKYISLCFSAAVLAASSAGAIQSDVEAKYLRPGISLSSARKLSAGAVRTREARLKERRAARVQLFEAVSAATQSARASFLDAVSKDPSLKAGLKQYETEGKALKLIAGKPQKKVVEAFKLKYRPLFAKIFQKANIDVALLQRRAEDAIHRASSHRSFRNKKARILWREFLSLRLDWLSQPAPSLSPQPEQLDIVLAAPFPNVQEEGSDATTDRERGTYRAVSKTFFLGGNNTLAGLGHFVDIPGGFDDMRVTAALPDTEYSALAIGIGGASGAAASSTVEIFRDNEIVCEETFDHVNALAIVGWIADEEGIDTYNITCDTEAPGSDTEAVLSFYGEAETWAGGLADSLARVFAKPRDLKIRLTP
jgi:hypothetical protein